MTNYTYTSSTRTSIDELVEQLRTFSDDETLVPDLLARVAQGDADASMALVHALLAEIGSPSTINQRWGGIDEVIGNVWILVKRISGWNRPPRRFALLIRKVTSELDTLRNRSAHPNVQYEAIADTTLGGAVDPNYSEIELVATLARSLSRPQHAQIVLAVDGLGWSMTEIGALMGKDPCTVSRNRQTAFEELRMTPGVGTVLEQ